MHRNTLHASPRWAAALWLLLGAAAGPALGTDVESPGPLSSARYLSAEQLSGADWKVEPTATTDGFGVDYTVTSRFGTWPAHGRTQVALRIGEIRALAELEKVAKSDVFLEAVRTSATAPLRLFSAATTEPVETLKGVPTGVNRWLKRTAFQVKEGYHDAKEVKQSVAGGETAGGEGSGGKEALVEKGKVEATRYVLDYLQVSRAELAWYAKLGVDPYTDNELLRNAVRSVARVEGLTSFGMKLAMPGIPGAREVRKTMDLVWTTDPWDLRLANRKKLLTAGLAEETARAFEDNPALSLSQQTALVEALAALAGVAGRQHLVARAIDVDSRQEGSTLVSAVALLLRFHRQQEPLSEFLPGARLPVARTSKGELVAVVLADALFWTAGVAEATPEFAALHAADPATTRTLWVVGEASPGFRSGAGASGWAVRDRWQLLAPEDRAAD